jgi:glycosyltransferase involved in cell wall biosynthesis
VNVSVVIPVYKAERFIRRAVESALDLEEVREVVLVEDGSPDNSLGVCKELAKKNLEVKLFTHPGGINLGAGASRNLCIDKATQDYVSFLDADDFFTDIRYKKEKEIFDLNPDCEAVYGAIGTKYFDERGAKAWEKKGFNEDTLTTVSKPIRPEHLFEYLIGFKNPSQYNGYYSIIGYTVKRKALIRTKIRFDEKLKLHQDTLFLWQCAFALKNYTGEYRYPVAMRHVHENNRFIQSPDLHYSRQLMYSAFLNWCANENMRKELLRSVCDQYVYHMERSSGRFAPLTNYIGKLISSASFRKATRQAQFNRVIHKALTGK